MECNIFKIIINKKNTMPGSIRYLQQVERVLKIYFLINQHLSHFLVGDISPEMSGYWTWSRDPVKCPLVPGPV